jgi:dynein heavy chain
MGKAGGGRNEVDPRFMSLFSVYNMPFPTANVLKHIYSSILTAHMSTFSDSVKDYPDQIVLASLELFQASCISHADSYSDYDELCI